MKSYLLALGDVRLLPAFGTWTWSGRLDFRRHLHFFFSSFSDQDAELKTRLTSGSSPVMSITGMLSWNIGDKMTHDKLLFLTDISKCLKSLLVSL